MTVVASDAIMCGSEEPLCCLCAEHHTPEGCSLPEPPCGTSEPRAIFQTTPGHPSGAPHRRGGLSDAPHEDPAASDVSMLTTSSSWTSNLRRRVFRTAVVPRLKRYRSWLGAGGETGSVQPSQGRPSDEQAELRTGQDGTVKQLPGWHNRNVPDPRQGSIFRPDRDQRKRNKQITSCRHTKLKS